MSHPHRRRTFLLASGAAALGTALARPASAAQPNGEDLLRHWFADTYRSLEAMVVDDTGLPVDNIVPSSGQRLPYTSTTNMACWMWSTIAAAGLGVISEAEMNRRLGRSIASVERLERVRGFWFNWYDPFTLEVRDTFPDSGDPVTHLLSTVDNGWLDVGLRLTEHAAEPALRDRVRRLREGMDWSLFFEPFDPADPGAHPGQMHNGFLVDEDRLAPGFFGALNSETRIATWLGIADGTVPAEAYWRLFRTFPPEWGQEMPPTGERATEDGVEFFRGHYVYRKRSIVPSWGGSMFEAMMPALFVPEGEWSPHSWGLNQRRFPPSHRDHGLIDAEYGYWGFSPCTVPEGGYQEYGVQFLGISDTGYCSNTDRTYIPFGQPMPDPSAYTNGVVTPHAVFLALPHAGPEAMANLRRLARDFDLYEDGLGFFDSVNVRTGRVSDRMLSLDQGMVTASLANVLRPGLLQAPFRTGGFASRLKPLLAREDFGIA